MCGIVGYIQVIIRQHLYYYGLSDLNRGYDSAGLAVSRRRVIQRLLKRKADKKVLADKTNNGESVPGTCGIGHAVGRHMENHLNKCASIW